MRILSVILGVLLAAWMVVGHVFWGIFGGATLFIYIPVGLVYIFESLYLGHKIKQAYKLQGTLRYPVYLIATLSWLCALAFGFLAPDNRGSRLDSILSFYGDADGDTFWQAMTLALCNPSVILALVILAGACVMAVFCCKTPVIEED